MVLFKCSNTGRSSGILYLSRAVERLSLSTQRPSRAIGLRRPHEQAQQPPTSLLLVSWCLGTSVQSCVENSNSIRELSSSPTTHIALSRIEAWRRATTSPIRENGKNSSTISPKSSQVLTTLTTKSYKEGLVARTLHGLRRAVGAGDARRNVVRERVSCPPSSSIIFSSPR